MSLIKNGGGYGTTGVNGPKMLKIPAGARPTLRSRDGGGIQWANGRTTILLLLSPMDLMTEPGWTMPAGRTAIFCTSSSDTAAPTAITWKLQLPSMIRKCIPGLGKPSDSENDCRSPVSIFTRWNARPWRPRHTTKILPIPLSANSLDRADCGGAHAHLKLSLLRKTERKAARDFQL